MLHLSSKEKIEKCLPPAAPDPLTLRVNPDCMLLPGLLPYYFEHLKQGKRSIQVDDCIYNNMAGRDWCKAVAKPYIKNVHFTFCMKPWDCWLWPEDHYCAYFTARWFELRAEVELAATGYAPSDAIDRCRTGKYEPITYLQATPSQSSDW